MSQYYCLTISIYVLNKINSIVYLWCDFIWHLQSEQFISRNTESAGKDDDMCSISMIIPKFSAVFVVQALTALSISKLIHLPPADVCWGMFLESRTENKN